MAENTSQTKLTPIQKLNRVVSRRSVDNLGSKLSLDKYIQPDNTDNEILFNSNTYKPDYWNISTESTQIWFEPKVTPRQLSETGGATFKSAGKVFGVKSSVSPTTARVDRVIRSKHTRTQRTRTGIRVRQKTTYRVRVLEQTQETIRRFLEGQRFKQLQVQT